MSFSLDRAEWREFFIGGDEGIFDVSSTSSGIDKNKLLFEPTTRNGEIPYITRTDIRNGISMFISGRQEVKYLTDEGGVITIGLDTQTVFFQPYKFFTGQNIQILRHRSLNQWTASFLIPLLKIQMKKFNWGGNGATLGRLLRTRVMLPVNKDEAPDWVLMEEYAKSLINNKRAKYIDYCTKELLSIKFNKIESLNRKRWKDFFLNEIFSKVQRGKRLTKIVQVRGIKPYVSSTASNNGVDNFIGNTSGVRIFSNCLTIANSGSVGSTFYHPYDFVASDHVTHLKNESFNRFVYLFIATQTSKLASKYNFNREINDKRISRDKVMLPTNERGEPDYGYMAQFMMNLEYEKRKKYLKYAKAKLTK